MCRFIKRICLKYLSMSKFIFYTTDPDFISLLRKLRKENKKIIFTNGVFDIIHRGHIEYLTKAKKFGDVLIAGLNSDKSVKAIKGSKRPIVKEQDRAAVLQNLKPVDYVVIFNEDNPYNLISLVLPNVLVKGADWNENEIIGADIVKANGGKVKRIKFVAGKSSTNIIKQVLRKYRK